MDNYTSMALQRYIPDYYDYLVFYFICAVILLMFFLGYTLAMVHYGQNVRYIRMTTEHDDTGVQTGAAREDKGTQTSLSKNVERWRLAYERVQDENRALRNKSMAS